MAADEPVWFPRLGAVPGVNYETPADVDVSKLRHRGALPTVYRFEPAALVVLGGRQLLDVAVAGFCARP